MGRALGIVNWVVAGLFLISAALQFNDPDPWRWALVYLAASVTCLLARRGDRGWWLAVLVGVVALGWAATLSPILPEMRLGDLAGSMKAENPRIEQSRELLGLAMICGWMVVLVATARRPEAG